MEFEETRAGQALTVLAAALDEVVGVVEDGGLDHLDTAEFVSFLQGFEAIRNRMPLVDHRALRDAESRDLAGALCQGRLSRVLTQALRISAGEAHRRVRAAEDLGDRVSMLGEPLPPVRPVLAAAQRDGSVTPEQVNIVLTGLAKVDRVGYDPAQIAAGEQTLSDLARVFGPKDLQTCTTRLLDCLDPDGSRPQDELNFDRRHVALVPRSDGSWSGELQLTGVLGSKLHALLSPLAKPRPTLTVTAAGREVETPDRRTCGQRLHDALEDLCDRLLRAADLPDSGGTPATVIVTIDYNHLAARTGHAVTTDGTPIPAARLLELADQADIIPTVLTSSGAVLSLGRSRRIASRAQTLALVARDSGCSFPGCSHPPEFCERHHIREWADGGPTDLDNLTLLCRYHHHNFASRGWTCRLNPDGIPAWLPPRHIDPTQTPLINARIQANRYTTAA
jgi:Domain of unknown function (DUF222)/HNH endonuclease